MTSPKRSVGSSRIRPVASGHATNQVSRQRHSLPIPILDPRRNTLNEMAARRFHLDIAARTLVRASRPPPGFPAVLAVSNLDLVLGHFPIFLVSVYPAPSAGLDAVLAAVLWLPPLASAPGPCSPARGSCGLRRVRRARPWLPCSLATSPSNFLMLPSNQTAAGHHLSIDLVLHCRLPFFPKYNPHKIRRRHEPTRELPLAQAQADRQSGGSGAAGVRGGRRGAEERKGGEWRMGRVWMGGLDKIGSGRAWRERADMILAETTRWHPRRQTIVVKI